jgi:hypothetical protein
MSFIYRKLGLCPCCPRHIALQLAQRRSVRALAAAAALGGIALDVWTFYRFGWL